jgi:hypothetical protein
VLEVQAHDSRHRGIAGHGGDSLGAERRSDVRL